MEVSSQLHALVALPLGKITLSTHWIGGWVSPKAGVDSAEKRKILPCQELNLGHPLHILSL
jgi:hypothetical protein